MDYKRCRKQVRNDDCDRCEWRVILLVPAHPGCPGQSPESHKMVVVVQYENMQYKTYMIHSTRKN